MHIAITTHPIGDCRTTLPDSVSEHLVINDRIVGIVYNGMQTIQRFIDI